MTMLPFLRSSAIHRVGEKLDFAAMTSSRITKMGFSTSQRSIHASPVQAQASMTEACQGIDFGRTLLRNTPDQRPRQLPHPVRIVGVDDFMRENPLRAERLLPQALLQAPPTALAVGGIVCGFYARILRDSMPEKPIRWVTGEIADAATSSSGNQAHISDGRPMYCRREFLPHNVVAISLLNSVKATFARKKRFETFDYLAVNIEWSALFRELFAVLKVLCATLALLTSRTRPLFVDL
eukprot:EC687769.1.p1 GENE.EC687769.1~~EC687769.1.p1  ORF type:complete len:238 (+),score=42.41 EC687769.1:84-797(+)